MDIQQQIEHYLNDDRQTVDLYRRLKMDDSYQTKDQVIFSGLTEHDYPRHDQFGVPFFYQSWHHSFPKELLDQFTHMQSNFATGLLPSIMRAWMSIDSDLYLWNFENNRDLVYYDAINNTILHVDVVKPKPGYSYPSLHSILVVATTIDILLIALSFHDSSGHVLSPDVTNLKNATIMMVGGAPLYRLSLDGLIVTNLCSTFNGRIFFAADDSLYELEYFEKSWFGTGGNCKKTNHSKRLINYIVPVLQIFYSKDSITQLALDESRHLLYVLMKSSTIQVFDLGIDGCTIQKFGAIYREQIEHMAQEFSNVNLELFTQIVQINPITSQQSSNVNFVATTSKGLRIYVTCLAVPTVNISPEAQRPSAIRVLHIRLPPDMPIVSPHTMNIYCTHQTHDCMLMATQGTDPDKSILLVNSTACFQFYSKLAEYSSFQKLEGIIWQIRHIRSKTQRIAKQPFISETDKDDCYPLCIEQHMITTEKFYVITSKGIFVYQNCSPLELFRHILTQFGNESKQFQAFASVVGAVELCIMSLAVLSSDATSDLAIKDMAIRVFLHYGDEQKTIYGDQFMHAIGPRPSTDGYMNGTLSNTSTFLPRTPLRTSTPQMKQGTVATNGYTSTTPVHSITAGELDGEQSILAGTRLINSARHEALFTFFTRIVKDIWTKNLCTTTKTNNLISLLSQTQVEQIGFYLNAFKSAIDEHSLINLPSTHHHYQFPMQKMHQHMQQERLSSNGLNLIEQERQSLLKLRNILGIACEVLALWGVLLEHELQAIFILLSPELQRFLLCWTFGDLVRTKDDACIELITALIRYYIGDDASTTAISDRLRQLCPTLFTVDNASVVRATENIYRVKSAVQPNPEMIQEAVAQFRKSIQKLNLVQTCDLLLQVLHFDGIVDLALSRALHDDPNDVALIVYKKHIASTDVAVNSVIKKRNEAYECILEVLRLLHTLAISHRTQLATLNLPNIFQSADLIKGQLTPSQAEIERDKVARKVLLESNDELACVSVFQWMIANGLEDQLISNKFKYFESFLFHEIEEGRGNLYMELLWKYYEKNQNYLEAAKVLVEMASKSTSRIDINQRITYLSNALMCIQSAPETRTNTEIKQDIQDKLDVAQIQLRTKALLETITTTEIAGGRGRETLDHLNYQLCDLTQLFNQAKLFDLYEIKLAVLHCAGKYDQEIVQNIWRDLLQKELSNRSNMETIQKNISSILRRLRRRYTSSPQFVPLDFILAELIAFYFKCSPPMHWLLDLCRNAEIPCRKLLSILFEQYRSDPFLRQNLRAFQFILDLAICLTEQCKNEAAKLKASERKILKNTCLDFLAELQLNEHYRMIGTGTATQRSSAERLEILHAHIEQIM